MTNLIKSSNKEENIVQAVGGTLPASGVTFKRNEATFNPDTLELKVPSEQSGIYRFKPAQEFKNINPNDVDYFHVGPIFHDPTESGIDLRRHVLDNGVLIYPEFVAESGRESIPFPLSDRIK